MFYETINLGQFGKIASHVFGCLSIVFNCMLIYCVKVRTSHVFMFADSYRWLIFVFAATDVFYSLVDMATGMVFHIHGNCLFAFLSKAPIFFQDELLKLLLLCLRCSTIPFCFGILQIHFIYRYILVCKPWRHYIFNHFPYICPFVLFFLANGVYWFLGTVLFCHADPDSLEFMNQTFLEVYGVPTREIVTFSWILMRVGFCMYIGNVLIVPRGQPVVLQPMRPEVSQNAWRAMCMAFTFFIANLTGFSFSGTQTYRTLGTTTMSTKAKTMNLQLLRILIVQTLIPIFATSESSSWHNHYMLPLL